MDTTDGWFSAADRDEVDPLAAAIRDGTADEPAAWPRLAVERGFVTDRETYDDALHDATMAATREAVREREAADDQQLVHAVRAMDDCRRTANELAERVTEWAGSVDETPGSGVEYARDLLAAEDGPATENHRIRSLAERVVDLADEAAALRADIDREAPAVAPNLSAMAGPVLTARLISLAGGLGALAKRPSGTVQVLGAEDALFAHLEGHAPSPKHGVIYAHEAIRGTRPEDRGSAARALAGKLAIAARVDHYSGDKRPELEAELEERLATIRSRAEGGDGRDGDGADDGGESDE